MNARQWIAIALLYLVALFSAYQEGVLPLFCPAYALLFVALAKSRWRHWPALLVGALLLEMLVNGGLQGQVLPSRLLLGRALPHAVGATVGALFWRLRRWDRSDELSLAGFVRILVSGALLGGVVSALLGTFNLDSPFQDLLKFQLWWLSDALGAVTVGTLLFWLWPDRKRPDLTFRGLLGVTGCFILSLLLFASPRVLAQPFLLYPPLTWLALRRGQVATNLALSLITLVAAQHTLNQLGPFSYLSSAEASYTATQLFCLTLTLSTLPISINVRDRARAQGKREKVRDELGQTEERYQTLFAHAGVPILVLGTQRIERANPAAQELFGLDLDSHQPTLVELSWPEQSSGAPMEDVWPNAFRDGAVLTWTARDRAGLKLELELHISHVKLPSGSKVQAVVRDNTRQMVLQRQLDKERLGLRAKVAEATAELENANQELDRTNSQRQRFLTTISHELKTPLTAIMGRAETLKEELWGPLTEEQKKALNRITESGSYLGELVSDLLDLAKVESTDVPVAPSKQSVAKLCLASLRLVRAMAEKHKVTLLEEDLPDFQVFLDARFFKQILVNLLTNAIKFTPSGGRVGVGIEKKEDTFEVSVWDTGLGISKEIQGRLFQPFFRADQSAPGFGLGLNLVRRLVEALGGTIHFESEPGEGTRFVVSLPYSGRRVPPEESQETFSLLLLECEEGSLTATAEYLKKRGHVVKLTHDEVEFLTVFAHWRPQLAILEMDHKSRSSATCLVTLETLRETSPQAVLLVLSRGCSGECEGQLMERGASSVVNLPIPLPDLERICANNL